MTASRIAIDGPASAGKTVVGQLVAKRLGYLFFDTGAMYRALGLLAFQHNTPTSDAEALSSLLRDNSIVLRPATVADGRLYDVLLNDEDVTWAIRQPKVDGAASEVAVHTPVRRRMVELQKAYGARGRVVMAGRDIGTVVMPNAELKVFLNASVEERTRRRVLELRARGLSADATHIRADLAERDRRDTSRLDSPLRLAEDSVFVETDDVTVDDVVERVVALAHTVQPAT